MCAGCSLAPRAEPADRSIGPYPANYEAAIRDYIKGSFWVAGFEPRAFSEPAPGVVIGEVANSPTSYDFGWLVDVSGEARPNLWIWFPAGRHVFLLRDGTVRTVVLGGEEDRHIIHPTTNHRTRIRRCAKYLPWGNRCDG